MKTNIKEDSLYFRDEFNLKEAAQKAEIDLVLAFLYYSEEI